MREPRRCACRPIVDSSYCMCEKNVNAALTRLTPTFVENNASFDQMWSTLTTATNYCAKRCPTYCISESKVPHSILHVQYAFREIMRTNRNLLFQDPRGKAVIDYDNSFSACTIVRLQNAKFNEDKIVFTAVSVIQHHALMKKSFKRSSFLNS